MFGQTQPSQEKISQSPDVGVRSLELVEREPHLDVASLMKKKNCYFIHMIQVTKDLDVSRNNEAVDTKKLTVADKLDILYVASPTLSVSSIRPHTEDGTFAGGFGVLLSHGEVISANPSDDGTVASSLTERQVIGGPKNSKEDVDKAIDRPQYGGSKSYNEIVLKSPEVTGGFMKLGSFMDRVTYEEEETDHGVGGGILRKRIGIINLANEVDERGNRIRGFDVPFATLLEMKSRGPVFVMDEANQMYTVKNIDEENRTVEFITKPMTPGDMLEVYGDKKMDKYTKEEKRNNLRAKGVVFEEEVRNNLELKG